MKQIVLLLSGLLVLCLLAGSFLVEAPAQNIMRVIGFLLLIAFVALRYLWKEKK